jgi:hypothetical protein
MASGGEHVTAASAGEETPLRKPEQGGDAAELSAPSGWTKKVCALFPLAPVYLDRNPWFWILVRARIRGFLARVSGGFDFACAF